MTRTRRIARPSALQARISSLAIVTADRPQALERCIVSYIGHLQRYGRSPRILIVDDSRDVANASAAKRVLKNVSRAYAGVIHYVGAREKTAAQRTLRRAGLPPSTLDFGLPTYGQGFAPGANRNHLLLATAGELLLTSDDDTVCTTWTRDVDEAGVSFVGHADPREFAFFTTRRNALRAAAWADLDLLGAHEQMLGQTLGSVAARSETNDVSAACEHIVAGLSGKDPSYRIRLTSSGVAGDSAMYSPYRMLFSPATTHHWTAIDQRTFRRALTRRETLRIVLRPTITHQSATMMYSAGLDNRTLMPPFIPVGANEDGLFGAMLRLIAPRSFLGYVPVGIVHDSNRGPTYDGLPMPCASQTRIAELTFALTHEWATSTASKSPSHALLRGLGTHLLRLSRLSASDFFRCAVAASLNLWERERDRLDAVIAATPQLPPFWLRTLERYRQTFLDHAFDPGFFVPIELKSSDSVRDGFRRTQAYIGNLGELMNAWPEIWTIARKEGLYRPT